MNKWTPRDSMTAVGTILFFLGFLALLIRLCPFENRPFTREDLHRERLRLERERGEMMHEYIKGLLLGDQSPVEREH